MSFRRGNCGSGACGGSGGGADVSRIITGADALNIGTTSNTASANGLPFAGEEFDVDSGATATVRLVRFISDNQTGETFLQVSEETLTVASFGEGEGEMDGLTGTLTLNGERVNFVDGEGVLRDGSQVDIFQNGGGDWSSIISVYSYVYGGTTPAPGFNTEGSFAIGLQTNPDNLPTTAGSTQYRGAFNGYSTVLDMDGNVVANEVQLEGETVVNVQFSDSTLDGTLSFETMATEGDNSAGETVPYNVLATLQLDEADIIGNGFATTANVVSACEAFACSSDTQIGGAFFGPNAEEVSGVAGINYSESNEEGVGLQVIGAGGFVAAQGGGMLE